MQKIIFSLVIACFMLSELSYADVFVITDKSGAIYTVSEKDDTVIPDGYTKVTLKGKMADVVPSSRPIDEYSFDGKNFKVNAKAVKAKEDAQLAIEQARDAEKQKKASAVNKLKALGLDESEVNALLGKD